MADAPRTPLTTNQVDALLRATGVYDTDQVEGKAAPDREINATTHARGLFVRGAHGGGSLLLNLLSRTALLLSVLLVVGVATGLFFSGRWVLRAMRGSYAAPAAPVPGATVVACAPVKSDEIGRTPGLREAARILDGRARAPRDPAVLARIGAASQVLQGDRVDLFQPAGARMAIRYVADSETVRSVSVSFATETSFCIALQQVGLFANRVRFQVSPFGEVTVLEGRADPVFEHAHVSVRTGSRGIIALQLARR